MAQIVKADRLNKLVYNVVSIDIRMRRSLWPRNLWGTFTFDTAGSRKLSLVQMAIREPGKLLMSSESVGALTTLSGYIRECGTLITPI